MRKRTRFLLLCCLSFLAGLSVNAQKVVLPHDAIAADTIESELYTSVKERTITYYDLGCKHQGWDGYFAPRRWHKTAIFGDGGVDVTEAPNAKVAEGATDARLLVQTGSRSVYTWRITVPADGYLYFRLEKVGSFLSQRISSTDTGLQLIHNSDILTYLPLPNGGYYSPHLKAGDTFGVVFKGTSQEFRWEDFTFYSNCVGVEVLTDHTQEYPEAGWRADSVYPIMKANIDQVFFRDDAPEQWPTLDQDGDLSTLDDQLPLLPGNMDQSPLELTYIDAIALHEGQYWQIREFTLKEPCSGNTLKIDRPWYPLPVIAPVLPLDLPK